MRELLFGSLTPWVSPDMLSMIAAVLLGPALVLGYVAVAAMVTAARTLWRRRG